MAELKVDLNAIAACLLSVLAFLGAGDLLMAKLFPRIDNSCKRILYAMLSGMACIAVALFLFGLCGFLDRHVIRLATVFIILWRRRFIAYALSRPYLFVKKIVLAKGFAWEKFLLASIIALFVSHIITALVPVWTHDVIRVNVEAPRRYMDAGRIFVLENNRCSFFPRYFDMLFMYELILGNDRSAALLSVFLLFLMSSGIALFSSLVSSMRTALGAVALFIYLGDVMANAFIPMYDLGWAVFLLTSAFALFAYIKSGLFHEAVLSAVFAGFAVGCKYPAGPSVLILWLLLLFWKRPGKIKAVFAYPAIAFLMVLPWFIFFWMGLGNPVWPFLRQIFAGTRFDGIFIASYISERYDFGLSLARTIPNFCLLPALMTFQPQKYFNCCGTTAPFFLIGLPYYLWVMRREDHVRFFGIFSILALVAWFMTSTQMRFIFALLAIASVFTVEGIAMMVVRGYLNRAVVISFAFLYIAFGLAGKAYLSRYTWPYVFGAESKYEFLKRSLPSDYSEFFAYEDYQWMNKNLPPDAVVLTEVSDKNYYLNRGYITIEQMEFYLREYKNLKPVEVYKKYHVTHIHTYQKRGEHYLRLVKDGKDSKGKSTYLYVITPFGT